MGKSIFFKSIIIMMCIISFCSCLDGTDEKKDWSEIVNLYVSGETGEYIPWGGDGKALKGIKIKEKEKEEWWVVHIQTVQGFIYEEGYSYLLKVKKNHLANPPADGSSWNYELIEIISKD